MALGWRLQLVLWTSPTMVLCCERRWLSHIRAGRRRAGDLDDEVTLTLPSQRPMIFQDSEVKCGIVWACWRRLSITLLTMAPRWNVPRCCAISFFERTLMCYVGHCSVTHYARSLTRSEFIQMQGWCGRNPLLHAIAYRGAWPSCCDCPSATAARW